MRFILAEREAQDSKAQFEAAAKVLKKGGVFIPDSVMLEAVWVLSRVYKLDKADYIAELRDIGGMDEVTLENPQRIAEALDWHETGMDFADALHLAAADES